MNFWRTTTIGLGVVVLALGVAMAVMGKLAAADIRELRNSLASRDETIEVNKGVYERLALEMDDLRLLLDSRDKEAMALKKELEKSHRQVLSVQKLVVKWKKKYTALVAGTQTEEPPATPDGPVRKRVDFKKSWGFIAVDGHTLTDPPEADITVEQTRPLKIHVAVSQDKQARWHVDATSSEEDVAIEVALAGVNPRVISPTWRDKLSVSGHMGIGSGALVGIGLGYKLGPVDLGPAAWVNTSGDTYVGGSISWRPFSR